MQKYILDENGNDSFPMFDIAALLKEGAHFIDGTDVPPTASAPCDTGLRLKGKLDLKQLEIAAKKAFSDIDTLRAQVNADMTAFRVLAEYDYVLEVRKPAGSDAEERLKHAGEEINAQHLKREFYAETAGKLLVYELDTDDHLLYFGIDHLLADGVSLSLFIKKIIINYYGMPDSKEINEYGIIDFAKFNQQLTEDGTYDRNTAYWTELAENTASLFHFAPPTDNARCDLGELILSYDLNELKQAAKQFRLSAANLILGAYHLALSDVYHTPDTIITTVAGARLIPDFFNTVSPQLGMTNSRIAAERTENLSDFFKKLSKQIFTRMKYLPTLMSKTKYSYFTFCYIAQEPMNLPGFEVSSWSADWIDIHSVKTSTPAMYIYCMESSGRVNICPQCPNQIIAAEDLIGIRDKMDQILKAAIAGDAPLSSLVRF